jgi:4-amino-4-deoxy-L-arabinose transferase-like glycosyltransferase
LIKIPSTRVYLFLIICAGFALRLVTLVRITTIEIDGVDYATMAHQFARGFFGEALNNVFPPVYPIFIALLHLVIPDVELAARLVSLVFGTLTIYLSFLAARKLLKSETKAVWAALLVAFHPFLIRCSGIVMSESVATCLFTLSVFAFYTGWQEDKRTPVAISGVCLTLTYLTRPEYIVFYGPFILLLLMKKRVRDSIILLLPFLCLGALYISFLHMETGLWIVSKKATLSPFVGLGAFFRNIPLVAYAFVIAVSPLFFLLAILGYRRAELPGRRLVLFIVIVHILSLSFIVHTTKRYSVELAPVVILLATEGIVLLDTYLARFFRKQFVPFALVFIVVFVGIWQSYNPPRRDRALLKKAGIFLLDHDPGSVIASRLPIAAFYAKGTYVHLIPEMEANAGMKQLSSVIPEKKVRYLVVDEDLAKELPALKEYLTGKELLREFTYHNSFARVYQVDNNHIGGQAR